MLSALAISDVVLIDRLDLNFEAGLCVLTGETGAGKSIMIDALMLALGSRADTSVIRQGEDKCSITATFALDAQSKPARWLAAHDIDGQDNQLIMRRVLYAEGRTKLYINGQPLPLQQAKELGQMLVHIHGQHQYQTLMQAATHRLQLDHYAKHEVLLKEVEILFNDIQGLEAKLEALIHAPHSADRQNLLQFQIDELSALELKPFEAQALNDEHQMLHHAQDYLSRATDIAQLLNNDESSGIYQQLNKIMQLLKPLPTTNTTVANLSDLIQSAMIQCEEAHHESARFAESIELNPERLQEVEARLSHLHQMARKYQVDIDALPVHLTELEQALNELLQAAEHQVALEETLALKYAAYDKKAQQLRLMRAKAAPKLSADITHIIQKLGMPRGIIELKLSPLDKRTLHGIDKVEYHVTTNPGLAPDTLAKIASGGELSRISLAIEMVTAQQGSTPTLFFDEVDAGIGGATAALVGQLLRDLGTRLQVFCVTHQPQVAACAHHHCKVSKTVVEAQTFSAMTQLDKQARIDEIARMLGGLTITDQTRKSAVELLGQ